MSGKYSTGGNVRLQELGNLLYVGKVMHFYDVLTDRCIAVIINHLSEDVVGITVFPRNGPLMEGSRRVYGAIAWQLHDADKCTDKSNWRTYRDE